MYDSYVRFTTPSVHFYFLNIFHPRKNAFGREQYSLCAVFDKNDPCIGSIQRCIEEAYQKGLDLLADGGAVPPLRELNLPLGDGDIARPQDIRFKGKIF